MVEDRLLLQTLRHGDADALRRVYMKCRNDLNVPEVKRLALAFRMWPDPIWERVKEAGQWIEGYETIDEPYQEGGLWMSPPSSSCPAAGPRSGRR